jgi:ABC-type nitrate/sulfonate/bicarbonate transport system substrate-binding protein
MKTQNQRTLILLIILISAILLFVFYKSTGSSISYEKIIIADAQQPVFALVYVADKMGYFMDEGLEVSYTKFIFGKDALLDVINSKADLATVYESPVVRKVYEGESLSAITTLHNSKKSTAVIGLKAHGINSASDLKGKKIAVPKGTNSEFFLYSLMLINEIDLSEVAVIDMPPDQMEMAMKEGRIDGVSLFNPYFDIVEHGFDQDQISTIYSDTYTEMSLLVGRREYVKENSQKLTKLLKALVKAEKYTEENPKQAIEIVDNWLPNYSEEVITRQWGVFNRSIGLNNTLLTILEREALFYRDAGFYQEPPPGFREVIFTDYLKQVKPEGVTIF